MTAFTTEIWSKTLLMNLKNAEGGFAARIVNHNFHNPGGTKADSVKAIKPSITAIGTATTTGNAMPTYNNADSTTVTINLNTPIKYAVGLPWELQLKTEHDVINGYMMTAEDICYRIRSQKIVEKLDEAVDIPAVAGTVDAPVVVTKDNILEILTKLYVQLLSTGAILDYGTYRFVDTEDKQVTETALDTTPMEMEGDQPAGVLNTQIKTDLPVLGCPAAIYELIINAATKAGELTQEKEFYGNVKVVRGFKIVLDNLFDKSKAEVNPHYVVYAGTRNAVTEAMTDSRSEVLPDKDEYRDILRGLIVYGAEVVQPLCAARAFLKLAA